MPLWWRTAPAGDVPPGGHAVIAACFTNSPAPFELAVDATGGRLAVAVPAPSFPRERIADVAFAPRGREVFVKVESRGVPAKTLLLDGVETPRDIRDLVRGGRESPRVARKAIAFRAADGATHGAFWVEGRRRSRTFNDPQRRATGTLPLPAWLGATMPTYACHAGFRGRRR